MAEINYEFHMMQKLREVVERNGYNLSVVQGARNNPGMADFIINLSSEEMVGLKMNPPMANKPFKLFPFGNDLTLHELEALFVSRANGREEEHAEY